VEERVGIYVRTRLSEIRIRDTYIIFEANEDIVMMRMSRNEKTRIWIRGANVTQ